MITDFTAAKKLDAELLGIPQQLKHYLSEIKTKRAANHHHYSASVHQLKNWVAKLESLTTAQKTILAKVNPIWTEAELTNLHDSLVRIDAAVYPCLASCLHDGCWSLLEIEKLQLSESQLSAIQTAVEKELGDANS